METSFFMLGAEQALGQNDPLMKLSKIIDWKKIESSLVGIHSNDTNSQGGPKSYDNLSMFKAVLLGQWYNLSDRELERSLKVRIDFMLFTGLELGEEFPDASTLCRFRNKLVEKGLDNKLFRKVNKQLEEIGLLIEKANGAVIDATIIESVGRPRRMIESKDIAEDRKEEQAEEEINYEVRESRDRDARWLKKGKRCYFGYKGFASTEEKHGFIQEVHVTPANKSECGELEKVLETINPKSAYADKAYASKANRNYLKERGIKDRILYKAARNKPLTKWQKKFNRLASKTRFIGATRTLHC
jgi:IS5 family transposase